MDKDKAVKYYLPLRPHSGMLPYLTLKKSLMMSNMYLLDLVVCAQNVLLLLCIPVSVYFFSIWLTALDALIVLCTFKGTTHLFLPPDCA